jgi:phage baseplate assembly protein W
MAPLSDYNKAGYKAKVLAANADQLFADLNLSLPIHPNKNDIIPLTDIDAIKQSVKNILLTNFGEKLFKPKFGSHVSGRLFENASRFVAISIRDDIKRALEKYERRIKILEINVIENIDSNAYDVSLTFQIVGQPEITSMEFALNRLR